MVIASISVVPSVKKKVVMTKLIFLFIALLTWLFARLYEDTR